MTAGPAVLSGCGHPRRTSWHARWVRMQPILTAPYRGGCQAAQAVILQRLGDP
jgi:hypothetical protein